MEVPEKIYLQVGESCEEINADFGGGEVTWSVDRVYATDIEYVNAATIARLFVAVEVEDWRQFKAALAAQPSDAEVSDG